MLNSENLGGRVPFVLLLLRLGVFIVMLVWALDKFFSPGHASQVFEAFYKIGGIGNGPIYVLGAIQLALVLGFVTGFKKTWTYGAVLLMHGVSTLVSFPRYLDPFTSPNLLFLAAWPMLAACFALFYLRDLDNLWVIEKQNPGKQVNY
jgi:putative oxidoreductase